MELLKIGVTKFVSGKFEFRGFRDNEKSGGGEGGEGVLLAIFGEGRFHPFSKS